MGYGPSKKAAERRKIFSEHCRSEREKKIAAERKNISVSDDDRGSNANGGCEDLDPEEDRNCDGFGGLDLEDTSSPPVSADSEENASPPPNLPEEKKEKKKRTNVNRTFTVDREDLTFVVGPAGRAPECVRLLDALSDNYVVTNCNDAGLRPRNENNKK